MLTPREATEAPRQGSRSPLSPTEVTESATVRLLILSALLCSVNNADLKTTTWLLYNWGERERAPSFVLNGRTVTIDIYSTYN